MIQDQLRAVEAQLAGLRRDLHSGDEIAQRKAEGALRALGQSIQSGNTLTMTLGTYMSVVAQRSSDGGVLDAKFSYKDESLPLEQQSALLWFVEHHAREGWSMPSYRSISSQTCTMDEAVEGAISSLKHCLSKGEGRQDPVKVNASLGMVDGWLKRVRQLADEGINGHEPTTTTETYWSVWACKLCGDWWLHRIASGRRIRVPEVLAP